MPIDPSIALSYRPVSLDITGAMQAAEERKALRSRNALAASQMANEQDELRNALNARQYAGATDLSDPKNAMGLLRFGKQGGDMYQSLLAGQASSASARKAQIEASGVKAGQYRQMLSFVNNPNDAMQWIQMHHDDPDMQDSPVARMPLDVAMARIPQDAAGFQRWKQMAALGMDEFIKRNTMTAEQESTAAGQAATREETRRSNLATEADRAARLRLEQQKEQRAAGETAFGQVAPPKLKQGERWNPKSQSVEAVPGSSEYIKQSKLHGKDYSSVTGIQDSRKLADKKIDYLLAPENEDAFNNLFGGYNAAISSRFPGKTAAARTELNSLKSNIKNAGLRLIQQGGKIGAITEREWPILEGMISELDSSMDEESARAKLAEIKSFFAQTEVNALDEYETTWGNTQYYKPHKTDAGAPATPPAGAAPTPAAVDHLLKNPSLAVAFDQKYGAGASAKYLKGK